MGKSGRHKKLNRQEKAKTQLKGVKTLLKAQNIVNPTLKVKKIVIREQLANAPEGEVSTKKHQTLQELLSSLHHHNTNLRKDALTGLQELVIGHRSILKQNLDKILERVAALTSDLESIIRKENLKLAEAIFQRVEESELQPFWSLILTHLKYTLTHLNPTVRYSTLPFFQLLINYFPNLVSGSSQILLSSLLCLISSSTTTSGIQKSRLNVEISGKHNEVQERLRVFALIGFCLQLKNQQSSETTNHGLKINTNSEAFSDNSKNQETDIKIFSTSTSKVQNEFIFNPGQKQFLGICYPYGYDSLTPSGMDTPPTDILESTHRHHSSAPGDDENQFWPRFIQSCLACLTQTWIEAGPSSISSTLASSSQEPQNNNPKLKMSKNSCLNGKSRQRDFDIVGSDKTDYIRQNQQQIMNGTRGSEAGNRSTNLNPGAVDILKSVVAVMTQLVFTTTAISKETTEDPTSHSKNRHSNDFIRSVRQSQGADLKKYFFSHLPYVAIQESHKRTLTTVNLHLFLLAAQFRLIDSEIMSRLETLIDDLIEGGTLDEEQCSLILRFLCCSDSSHSSTRNKFLSTGFICCVLSSKDHRREICKFLRRILRPDNKNSEEMFLVQSLDWEIVTSKLMNSFSRISSKLLNLLTHIAIRRLADVKTCLIDRIEWFQEQLEQSSPVALWNECIRLFLYSDALSEFEEAFEQVVPPEFLVSLQLDEDLH